MDNIFIITANIDMHKKGYIIYPRYFIDRLQYYIIVCSSSTCYNASYRRYYYYLKSRVRFIWVLCSPECVPLCKPVCHIYIMIVGSLISTKSITSCTYSLAIFDNLGSNFRYGISIILGFTDINDPTILTGMDRPQV